MTTHAQMEIARRLDENTLLVAAGSTPLVPPTLADDILDRTRAALEQGNTHYVDVPGIMPLRQRLAAWIPGMPTADATAVMVTAGIQDARFHAVQVLGDGQGSVAVPTAVDPGVRRALGVRSLPTTWLPAEAADGFLPTVEIIAAALRDGAKLVYLESPSRLSGAVYHADAMVQLAQLAVEHDALVVVDQGLAPWTVEPYASLLAQPNMAERAVALGEAFPGVGLEPLLVGYIAAPPTLITQMTTLKQIMAICTSTPTQYAALAAADGYDDALAALRDGLAADHAARVQRLGAVSGDTYTVLATNATDTATSDDMVVDDGAIYGVVGVRRLAVSPHASATEGA